MVLLFFCVHGAFGKFDKKRLRNVSTDADRPLRDLTSDVDMLAQTLKRYPGVLVIVGNDWPLASSVEIVRSELTRLRPKIADVLDRVEVTREEAVLEYVAERSVPFAILASPGFTFTPRTAHVRVDVTDECGFDSKTVDKLELLLSSFGAQATSYLTFREFRDLTFYRDPRQVGKAFTSLYLGYSVASLMGLSERGDL